MPKITKKVSNSRVSRKKKLRAPRINFKEVRISTIQPYERNPRDNTEAVESVMNSIQSFGFLVPIVVDKANTIVAGHTRYEAARQLGLTTVPIVEAGHLTKDQVTAFRIIDNKVSELARWDFDLLAPEISMLADSGINLTSYGFKQEEIDCLSDVVADDCLMEEEEENDDPSAAQSGRGERRAPIRTRLQLGEYTLFVPSSVYRDWVTALRNEFDYNEASIKAELQQRLGIAPYLEQYRRQNPDA